LELSKPGIQNAILIASSWGNKGLINAFPLNWIETLAKGCKREIIIRPHPQSFISDMDAIKEIENLASKYINLKLDREISPLHSMSMSSILISDTSSIRYDFAFLLERPVITIDIPKSNLSEYEASDFDVSWDLESRIFIGQVVLNPSDINNELIEDLITHHRINDNINYFKNKTLNSTGNSAELIIKKSLEYLS
jgi:CDP-glycerol glycerophosphotransferase (TagB/SpsB family)